jgi:AcrR family transcriptional regulator
LAERAKPVKRNRRFTERRLEILRSAAAAFTRNGFTGTTMEEIAQQAQMAKGNLYYYFPSKQELLFFCQDYSLTRLNEQATTIVKSKQPADAKLRALIAVHVHTVLEELPGSTAHTDFRLLPREQLRKIVRKRDRYEKAYRKVVDEGIAEGVFEVSDPKTAVWAILGALNWTVQWYSPSGTMTVQQISRDFGDLFAEGLGCS